MRYSAAVIGFALLLVTALTPRAATPQPDDREPDLSALLNVAAAKPDPNDDALHKLLKERYNEAVGEVRFRYQAVRTGSATINEVAGAIKRLLHAGLDLSENPADRVALLEDYAAFAREMEKLTLELVRAGDPHGTQADLYRAKYFRADAEIQLLREKEKGKSEKK